MTAFTIARHALPVRRRRVAVHRAEDLTPSCRRIYLAGDELDGFQTPGADDHVRLFFPAPGEPLPQADEETMPVGLASRELTPAVWDPVSGVLGVDIVLHYGSGVASEWASRAQVGDEVFVGGPRRTLRIEGDPDWWLMVGDLTALPAIRRFVASVPSGARVNVVVLADIADDEQELPGPGEMTVRWVHSAPGEPRGDVRALVAALDDVARRDGDGFAFVAAEQAIVTPARQFLAGRGVDLDRAVVKGYWKRGVAEYHESHGPSEAR